MVQPIKLYSVPTPNGIKVSIFLELLKLPYEAVFVDISKNELKSDWFVKLNPNGRIPTITDPNFETGPVTISQTGAILQYLADQYDKDHKYSYPQGTAEYYKTLEYLIFQVAENGPIQGQLNHFKLYAPEKLNTVLIDTKMILKEYMVFMKIFCPEILAMETNTWLVIVTLLLILHCLAGPILYPELVLILVNGHY